MSTSYLVSCPHMGCDWSGRLPASPESEAWRGTTENDSIVAFQCPNCHESWRARSLGDYVEVLPLWEQDLEPAAWPAVDIGVGD